MDGILQVRVHVIPDLLQKIVCPNDDSVFTNHRNTVRLFLFRLIDVPPDKYAGYPSIHL